MSHISRIKIGVLAPLSGPLATLGRGSVRGVKLALAEFGAQVASKPVELIVESTLGLPENTRFKAEELIKKQYVDLIIGPLSSEESLAIRDLAQTYPDHTFLNGVFGAPTLTLDQTAPNFYNFGLNSAQAIAGLGRYAYHTAGYRRIAILAENYLFPRAQIAGFKLEFCALKGQIVAQIWLPLGSKSFPAIVDQLPADCDAILSLLNGADTAEFIRLYRQTATPKPVMGGTITTDQTALANRDHAEHLLGLVAAGPTADDNPDPRWQRFVRAHHSHFPAGFAFPSSFAHGYYTNTKAALLALQAVDGNLASGQERFRTVLDTLAFDAPGSHVWLDHKRGAVASNFITLTDRDTQGNVYRRLLAEIPEVTTTLGLTESDFLSHFDLDGTNPDCP